MFLHIGENIIIPKKDIVTIIAKDSVVNSEDTEKFINNMIKNGLLCNENHENVRTYIITCVSKVDRKEKKHMKKYALYTSNISSTTLLNREYINI